jgi:D-inositol-3-phosphate glycosyltransferase
VMEGTTGFLVRPADPAAIREKLLQLILDPDLCLRMGQAGRLRIASVLSLDATMRGIRQIYLEALQKAP